VTAAEKPSEMPAESDHQPQTETKQGAGAPRGDASSSGDGADVSASDSAAPVRPGPAPAHTEPSPRVSRDELETYLADCGVEFDHLPQYQVHIGLRAVRDLLDARAALDRSAAWLANVSGALVDAGVVVPGESGYGEAVRALSAERVAALACCEVLTKKYAPDASFIDLPDRIEAMLREASAKTVDDSDLVQQYDRAEAAEARCVALEAALREMANALDSVSVFFGDPLAGAQRVQKVASEARRASRRAVALATSPPPEPTAGTP